MDELKAKIAELERELARAREGAAIRAFDYVPVPVISVDSDGQISGFNDAALVCFGALAETALSGPLRMLFDEESGVAIEELCKAGFVGAGDHDVRLSDQRLMGFAINRVNRFASYVLLQDRSQREKLEAELRYARRMASVGRLASEVAHEINNPLAVIQGRLEMLKAVPDMPVDIRQRHLGIVEEHSGRVARIVQNLQVFARPRLPNPEVCSLSSLIQDSIASLGRRLERVNPSVEIEPGLVAFLDAEQATLVWQNILSSAAGVMPAHGKLTIGADAGVGGSVKVRIECEAGTWPEDILSTLRSPYAGDRERVDPGRGLALAISWGIVQDHGGWMTAQNELGGASIEVYFPGAADGSVQRDAMHAGKGTWDVLVVDDNEVMAETVSWMLSTFGHRSVVVHTAEKALEHLDRDVFHLIISDHRLPKMDGETMLGIVHERWPEMGGRTILTSGLLHRPAKGQIYLQKPFSRAQLSAALGQVND